MGGHSIGKLTDDEIMERVMFPVINECFRVVAEDVVVRSSDIDIISIMGYGFPAYRCAYN